MIERKDTRLKWCLHWWPDAFPGSPLGGIMTARDVMVRDVITIAPRDSVAHAAKLIAQKAAWWASSARAT
jgi:hypothetical protein